MTKVKTVRFDENSPVGQWADNQEDFSKSVRKAIDFIVKRYGTDDLFSSMVDEAMGNSHQLEPNRVNKPRVKKETPEQVTIPKTSTPTAKKKETKQVAKPSGGLKAKIQSKRSSQDNESGSEKKKTRKGINLNMLSD